MYWLVDKQTSLHSFLCSKLELSGRKIKKAIDNNLCSVNGKIERFSNTTVYPGDKISFRKDCVDSLLPKPKSFQKDRVLFEDEYLLAYDKPPGISSTDQEMLLQKQYPGLLLVHRLDRDTSGVLIFAKSKDVFQRFVQLFKEQAVHKTYLAVVEGSPKKNSGEIENYLGKCGSYDGATIWGIVPAKRGKYACTHWEVVKRYKNTTLIRCSPLTGRTHQIRIHMDSIGHSIVGDYRYNSKQRYKKFVNRHLLHAHKIMFPHPISNQQIDVEAPLPKDFV